jgi:hypothetical protein
VCKFAIAWIVVVLIIAIAETSTIAGILRIQYKTLRTTDDSSGVSGRGDIRRNVQQSSFYTV